jgi:hypothetical protein
MAGWRGQRRQRVLPEIAGPLFGNRAQSRLDLQSQYDIAIVKRDRGAETARRVRPADET